MSPIKGRLESRKNAVIELDGRDIKISTGGGFFGGKPTSQVISLDDVKAVESGTGVKPYPDAAMIKLTYTDEELAFFSVNKAPLQNLAEQAISFVEKRAKLLVEMEKEFMVDREAHVELLFLNLELVDALMSLVVNLHGSVDWERVERLFTQVKRVNQDRDNLTYMRPSHLSLDRLEEGLTERSSEVIKIEVYDIVFILSEICMEKAKHHEPWFNTSLHKLFLDALMILWSKQLEAITGESMGETSEKIAMRLNELRQLVADELGDEEIKSIDVSSPFAEARSVLFGWVERLQGVEFNPGEELEKRLAT
jgi:hypothetical protein